MNDPCHRLAHCLLRREELFVSHGESGAKFDRFTSASVFRDQEINIQEQLELARHFGPLHKHATTPIPKEPGLEEVHGGYTRVDI